MIGQCLILLAVVDYLTRATVRRFLGAFAGGVPITLAVLRVIALGEALGWWRIFTRSSGYMPPLVLGLIVSSPIVPLLSWRAARRFGPRGLAVMTAILAAVGPPRDDSVAARFPEWMVFGRGIAPVVAVAVTYAGMLVLGHAVMRVVAGPADADPLARRRNDVASRGDGADPTRRDAERLECMTDQTLQISA